jgi:sporulation protein YabP
MEETLKRSTLILEDRSSLTLKGALNILGFEEDIIILDTELGRLNIEGEELKIESLNKENKTVLIKGRISGLFYSEQKSAKGGIKGFFK